MYKKQVMMMVTAGHKYLDKNSEMHAFRFGSFLLANPESRTKGLSGTSKNETIATYQWNGTQYSDVSATL